MFGLLLYILHMNRQYKNLHSDMLNILEPLYTNSFISLQGQEYELCGDLKELSSIQYLMVTPSY